MKRDPFIEKIESVIEAPLKDEGYEIVHIEYRRERGRWVLRIYIDREEGQVTIDDCVKVDQIVGVLLDVKKIIDHSYTLEISSPGLDRPLAKKADFRRFAGQMVRIKTDKPISDRRNFRGLLVGINGETVKIKAQERIFDIPYDHIVSANIEYQW